MSTSRPDVASSFLSNTSSHDDLEGGLSEEEVWWRDHQVWLQERGYLLRPRYRPDWVPSWKKSDVRMYSCEDGQSLGLRVHILDATRIRDNVPVTLKRLKTREHPYEIQIGRYLSSEPLASDPKNHCVPILEVLDLPEDDNTKLLVMPLLRIFDNPPFLTVGEAVEFMRQAIEGVQFMHNHHVAHRDIGELNVMMDPRPLYPQLYHFILQKRSRDFTGYAKHYTRTRCPVKYYFIDFGISRKYDPAAGPPRAWPIWGADKTVPEFHKSDDPCDPFPTDIYYLGNLFRIRLLQEYAGLDFMQPLVDKMVHDEPANRPSIDQVATRFEVLLGSLSTWRLRARLRRRNEHWLISLFRGTAHLFRTIYYILTSRPALPRPRPVVSSV